MDQQGRDERLDQAATHSVGHNTSQITTFMIYGMVSSSCASLCTSRASWGPRASLLCMVHHLCRGGQATSGRLGQQGARTTHRLDARADTPDARRSSEKERAERINEAFYGY